MLEVIKPPIRWDKVQKARRKVANGDYDSGDGPEIDVVVDRLMEDAELVGREPPDHICKLFAPMMLFTAFVVCVAILGVLAVVLVSWIENP